MKGCAHAAALEALPEGSVGASCPAAGAADGAGPERGPQGPGRRRPARPNSAAAHSESILPRCGPRLAGLLLAVAAPLAGQAQVKCETDAHRCGALTVGFAIHGGNCKGYRSSDPGEPGGDEFAPEAAIGTVRSIRRADASVAEESRDPRSYLALVSDIPPEALSNLTLSAGPHDFPLSDPGLGDTTHSTAASRTAPAQYGVNRIAISPAKHEGRARIGWLEASDRPIAAADRLKTPQRVQLNVGTNTLGPNVTAGDARIRTHALAATRSPTAGPGACAPGRAGYAATGPPTPGPIPASPRRPAGTEWAVKRVPCMAVPRASVVRAPAFPRAPPGASAGGKAAAVGPATGAPNASTSGTISPGPDRIARYPGVPDVRAPARGSSFFRTPVAEKTAGAHGSGSSSA